MTTPTRVDDKFALSVYPKFGNSTLLHLPLSRHIEYLGTVFFSQFKLCISKVYWTRIEFEPAAEHVHQQICRLLKLLNRCVSTPS